MYQFANFPKWNLFLPLIHNTDNPLRYNEIETFDNYDDIFTLEDKEKVKANTPLVSFEDKKFAYVL